MSDPGKYRTREEVQETRENRDPIERIRSIILAQNFFSEEELSKWDKEIRNEVSDAAEKARNEKKPDEEELFKDIYMEDLD
tara:strand:- start:849 stop:1091 length:243 start_codon:yes stop_codon:yes gene_type:complete